MLENSGVHSPPLAGAPPKVALEDLPSPPTGHLQAHGGGRKEGDFPSEGPSPSAPSSASSPPPPLLPAPREPEEGNPAGEQEKVYCICRKKAEPGHFMIECDACHEWFHENCIGISRYQAAEIEKYHCPRCSPTHGPTTLREALRRSQRTRSKPQVNYADLDNGIPKDENRFLNVLKERSSMFVKENFPRLSGSEVNLDYIKKSGLREPVIVHQPEGFGLVMPQQPFTIDNVVELIGGEQTIPVMEVATQHEIKNWNLYQFASYFKHPELRSKIVNVISLEFSGTKLAEQVRRPTFVTQLDWVDTIWPRDLPGLEVPKVQLYCLMSVGNCYTDFHIDFGGTSVYYHVLSGRKVFYFVPPTEENLRRYEKWTSSSEQGRMFFGDMVSTCYQCTLNQGETMIIPTGWIHAVFTPMDSIVIGGNFLHGFNIGLQLRVDQIEERTKVPKKYRFPNFFRILWFAAQDYYNRLEVPGELTKWELEGIYHLARYLKRFVHPTKRTEEEKARAKELPFSLEDCRSLVANLMERIKPLVSERDLKMKTPLLPSLEAPIKKKSSKKAKKGPQLKEEMEKESREGAQGNDAGSECQVAEGVMQEGGGMEKEKEELKQNKRKKEKQDEKGQDESPKRVKKEKAKANKTKEKEPESQEEPGKEKEEEGKEGEKGSSQPEGSPDDSIPF